MAPGKNKRKSRLKHSLSSYAQPSPHTREQASSGTHETKEVVPSVTEQLTHLRLTQAPRASCSSGESAVREITVRPPPRRRRLAGPAPPRSWTRCTQRIYPGENALHPKTLDYFPGPELPCQRTMLHQCLRFMAERFDWHVEVDHVYLSTLPLYMKDILLSYVAYYGSPGSLSLLGMKALFSERVNNGLIQSTNTQNLVRLDLGGSIGPLLTVKDLQKYFTAKQHRTKTPEEVPDSWEAASIAGASLRFPHLAKLSLAYPHPSASWSELITFSRHLGGLTHLSLAGWPKPAVSSTVIAFPPTQLSTADDIDLDLAADIIEILSRNTPCLEYLSLDDCPQWITALKHIPPNNTNARLLTRTQQESDFHESSTISSQTRAESQGVRQSYVNVRGAVNWARNWLHLRRLSLRHSSLPKGLNPRLLAESLRHRTAQLEDDYYCECSLTWTEHMSHICRRTLYSASQRAKERITQQVPLERLSEEYRVVAPNVMVAQSIAERARKGLWLRDECNALAVGCYVQFVRRRAGLGTITTDHGWVVEDLLELDYSEGDLLMVGLTAPCD